MKILISGGAGYIGSVMSAEALRAGHEVIVFDNLSTGHRDAVLGGARFVEGDLGEREQLFKLLREEKPDAVMHFSAASLVGESIANPAKYFRNNVAYTLNLLDALIAANIKRLVFSSTAAVYGNPARVPILEDARLQPVNPYGESKLMIEKMLHWFDAAYGLRYASLRYFNAAGATETLGENHTSETHLIPLVLQVALGQRPNVQIYGTDYSTPDHTAIRDYIHVLDLASAHLLALEALDKGSRVYNLGNGTGFSVREVIELARQVTGHPIPAVEAPRRAGDPPVLIASSARIQQELGWQPKWTSLADIIASAWQWHQSHPHGYTH